MINKWDCRFLDLAQHISTWSKDPSTQVGAVVVAPDKQVVGIGYNGFARGVEDFQDRYNNRELKYKFVVHAEVNALLMAGAKAKGASLYVFPSFAIPNICHDCCKFAIQCGIKEVVGYRPIYNERLQRWNDSIEISKMMLDETNTIYREVAKS